MCEEQFASRRDAEGWGRRREFAEVPTAIYGCPLVVEDQAYEFTAIALVPQTTIITERFQAFGCGRGLSTEDYLSINPKQNPSMRAAMTTPIKMPLAKAVERSRL